MLKSLVIKTCPHEELEGLKDEEGRATTAGLIGLPKNKKGNFTSF